MFTSRHLLPLLTPCVVLALLTIAVTSPIAAQRVERPALAVYGNGTETFVLLTGLVGGVPGFRQLEERLVARGYRVVVVDPYQLSLDSADVSFDALSRRVDRTLVSLGVSSARFVGHAHGGGVALRLASRVPERVQSIHLLDVGAQADERGPVFRSSMKLVPIIMKIPGGRGFVRRRFIAGLRQNIVRQDWFDDSTQRAYTEPVLDHIGAVIAMAGRLARAQEPEPVDSVIARIHVPLVVVLGETHTPAGPEPSELTALEPLRALVRRAWIPGAGHFVHEEAPDEVLRVLLQPPTTMIAHAAGVSR